MQTSYVKAILVDPADEGDEPSLLFLLTHEVKSGDGAVLSKRLQFVRVHLLTIIPLQYAPILTQDESIMPCHENWLNLNSS